MSDILKELKKYFAETPREQVLKDWAEAGEATIGIKSPAVKEFLEFNHQFRSIPPEEIMNSRSMAYEFIDFDDYKINSSLYNQDIENNKAC